MSDHLWNNRARGGHTIGLHYLDFHQLSDQEVCEALEAARGNG